MASTLPLTLSVWVPPVTIVLRLLGRGQAGGAGTGVARRENHHEGFVDAAVKIAVQHHQVVGALGVLVAVGGALPGGPGIVRADGPAKHGIAAEHRPAAGRRPGRLSAADRILGENAGARRHAQTVQKTVAVGERSGAVTGKDAGYMGAVAAAADQFSPGMRSCGTAGVAGAADDTAIVVGMVVPHPGIGAGPDHPAAVQVDTGKPAHVAGKGYVLCIQVAGQHLGGALVLQLRFRAHEVQRDHLWQVGQCRQVVGMDLDPGIPQAAIGLGAPVIVHHRAALAQGCNGGGHVAGIVEVHVDVADPALAPLQRGRQPQAGAELPGKAHAGDFTTAIVQRRGRPPNQVGVVRIVLDGLKATSAQCCQVGAHQRAVELDQAEHVAGIVARGAAQPASIAQRIDGNPMNLQQARIRRNAAISPGLSGGLGQGTDNKGKYKARQAGKSYIRHGEIAGW